MADGEDSYISPTVAYKDDKDDPDNYVQVLVDIPGLKKTLIGNNASNAEIEFDAAERSLSVKVAMKDKKNTTYLYKVKKLPDAIIPDKKASTYKVRKEEVMIRLRKVTARRWARELDSIGLETAQEDGE